MSFPTLYAIIQEKRKQVKGFIMAKEKNIKTNAMRILEKNKISANDFNTLCFGNDEEYNKFVKRITSKGVNSKNTNTLSLFN